MKVAIIHDWLVTYAGAEKVLEQILDIYPDADIYSVVEFLKKEEKKFIKNKDVNTTFVQKLPFSKKKYRTFLPLMPIAIEQFDLSRYDLIISSSHAVAKGVITGPDQVHISYVHSPIRYAWDLQAQYLKESGLTKGLKSIFARLILHYIRNWDARTALGVDYFIANSNFIKRRIWKVYKRDAKVIYPPVDISSFSLVEKKEDYYVTASRMVPYKKIDIIVEAFTKMPDKKLVVIGDGPDFEKIKKKAGENVQLLGYQSFEVLKHTMSQAKAFVFAAEEDFGITPVEAQACGTPVIAFGKGGALETVVDYHRNPKAATGMFFYEQSASAIVQAVNEFEEIKDLVSPKMCVHNAQKFSNENFKENLENFVNEVIKTRKNENEY